MSGVAANLLDLNLLNCYVSYIEQHKSRLRVGHNRTLNLRVGHNVDN